MKASEALQGARKLIDAGWCQGSFAKDKDGRAAYYSADRRKAVAYCMLGAIGATCYMPSAPYNSPAYDDAKALANKVGDLLRKRVSPETSLSIWNDGTGRTKDQVLELFDMAIGDAVEEEKNLETAEIVAVKVEEDA
jgi:hypothetical protein